MSATGWAGASAIVAFLAATFWYVRREYNEQVNRQTTRNVVATKPCTVPGCAGTMYFHERLTVAPGDHTLGWPWCDYWECAQDSTHVELLAARP